VADNLTNTAENKMLDALVGTASYSADTPIKLALVTANGNDATAGTGALWWALNCGTPLARLRASPTAHSLPARRSLPATPLSSLSVRLPCPCPDA